jgi:HD-GYP domain-containing protein (c-di-GMP phosphodiesterase class II)
MRDKAAKQPFDTADLPKAQRIADRVGELFASKNVFGQRFIQLSTTAGEPGQLTGVYSAAVMPTAPVPAGMATFPAAAPRPAPAAATAAATVAPPPAAAPIAAPPLPVGRVAPKLAAIINEAKVLQQALLAPTTETLTEGEILIAREVLRLILLIPGAVVASFATTHLGGVHDISARAAIGEQAIDAVQSKLDTWLQKRGEAATFTKKNVTTPFGAGPRQIEADDVQKVLTAPVNAAGLKGLYLTVAFAAEPDRVAHDLLAALHRQLQASIDQSIERRNSTATRRKIAERLLEPDFAKYPELRRHTETVAARVDAFVKFLGLSAAEIENARILAIVHDAGMRLLDYDKLYRKRTLSHDELELLQTHPIIGAALVEPFLGREVARAVLSHHERYDGGGYPNDLRGAQIPLLSRILQICDVYESMVSNENYQPPQTHDQAMTVIARGAGIQFDPELASRFAEMMRART